MSLPMSLGVEALKLKVPLNSKMVMQVSDATIEEAVVGK